MSNKTNYAATIGMPCKVFWATDGVFYEGKVLDFRRQLRGYYDDEGDLPSPGRPKRLDEADEVTAKKAFFVKYEDGEQEWIEIRKYEMETNEDDRRLVVTESKKLKHFWNAITKRIEKGDDYKPPSINKRKAELTQDHKLRAKNALDKQNASSPNPTTTKKQQHQHKRKAIAIEQPPTGSLNMKRVKAQLTENLKLKQRQDSKAMKPPGRRLTHSNSTQHLAPSKGEGERPKTYKEVAVASKPLNTGAIPYHMKAKFTSLEHDLFTKLGLPYSEKNSALSTAATTLKSPGGHINLRKTCGAISKAYAELSSGLGGGMGSSDNYNKQAGEVGRSLQSPSAGPSAVAGVGPSSTAASAQQQQSLQSKLASERHAQMLQNPFFKKKYETLVETFAFFSKAQPGQVNDELKTSTLKDWRGYKAIFEKSDGWWEDKEKEIKRNFRSV